MHFFSGAPLTLYDITNPDWVPTLNRLYDPASVHIGEVREGYLEVESDIRRR